MTWIIVDSFLSEDLRSRSPDKRYPRAHIVDVAALRLPHVISHEKMHIGRDPAHVAVELPLGTDLGRRDDVARAAFRRQFQVSRRAVHAIMRRVPPEHVAPERHEHVCSGQLGDLPHDRRSSDLGDGCHYSHTSTMGAFALFPWTYNDFYIDIEVIK